MSSGFHHALVLGKFLPPHRGHLDIIVFAAGLASRVTVLVEHRPDEPIPVEVRSAWLRAELGGYPHVLVLPLEGDHPQAPPAAPAAAAAFWSHWAATIRHAAGTVDAVVAGDSYGERLALGQDATWVPFDRTREPVSATAFKSNPWTNWDWLVPSARVALLRRVLIVGSESTGKSTLAGRLVGSARPPTVLIPEYAEHWLRCHPSTSLADMPWDLFLDGQAASNGAWSARAHRWLLEDSNALTTAVWAHMGNQSGVAERAMGIAAAAPPHHVFLSVSAGVPWVADFHRRRPDDRLAFDEEFRRRLGHLGWPCTILSGTHEERWALASATLDGWLDGWRAAPWAAWTRPPPTPGFPVLTAPGPLCEDDQMKTHATLR